MLGDDCRFSHDEEAVQEAYAKLYGGEICKSEKQERLVCGICLEDLSPLGEQKCGETTNGDYDKVEKGVAQMHCGGMENEVLSVDKAVLCGEEAGSQHSGQEAGDGQTTLFGLLSGCDHVFCLKCIKAWRGTTTINRDARLSCPVCRKYSDFVVPSFFHCRDAQKDRALKRYTSSCSKVPCRYFTKDGCCPFGDKCMFAHLAADGTRVTGVKAPNLGSWRRSRAQSLTRMLQQLMHEAGPEHDENLGHLIEQLVAIQMEFVMIEQGNSPHSVLH